MPSSVTGVVEGLQSVESLNLSRSLQLPGGVEQGKSGHNGRTSQSQFQDNDGTDDRFGKPPLAISSSLGDSVLLIVALCFHFIFEGIALLPMIPDRPLLSCAAYALAFAISSPIGVAIGIIIDATTQGVVADWIYAISMSLHLCIDKPSTVQGLHTPEEDFG